MKPPSSTDAPNTNAERVVLPRHEGDLKESAISTVKRTASLFATLIGLVLVTLLLLSNGTLDSQVAFKNFSRVTVKSLRHASSLLASLSDSIANMHEELSIADEELSHPTTSFPWCCHRHFSRGPTLSTQ